MPFDYAEYQTKCDGMSTEQLQKEWENYTRQIAGGATSTATSVLFSPLTAGVSLVGLGLSAPRIHNARKKREIIEKGLQARGTTHNTRSRDVAGSMAVSGVIAGLTLGMAGPLADAAAGEAVGKGLEYAVAHVALDGVGAGVEHLHDGHLNKKGQQELKMKAMQAQIAGLQNQQAIVNNGQMMQTQYYQGQQMQFQQPALTTGMALPQPGILMQNQQQVQWQQPHQGLQIPGMQQPNMVPGQVGFVLPMRSQSAAPDNHYGQYTQHQQQYAQQVVPLPQYNQVQQVVANQPQQYQAQPTEDKYHLNVIPNQPEQQQQQPQIYPNEKSAAYTTTAYMQGDQTPLPLYSESVEHHERAPHPQHIDLPAAPTMEEEISMLKAKLLQMELEKRGLSGTISGPMEISLDGGSKTKQAEKPAAAHEISTSGQTPPQQIQQSPVEGVKRKNTLTSMTNQTPQVAPTLQTERVASPAVNHPQVAPPLKQNQPHIQNAAPNVQYLQSATLPVQNQTQFQQVQYSPVQSQEQKLQHAQAQAAIANQQYTPQSTAQHSQNHQRQGSVASPLANRPLVSPIPQAQPAPNLYEAETPVTQYQTPAIPPQHTYPPQQAQHIQQAPQVPIYQPQPVNPQLNPHQPQQTQQQQPQYTPAQVSSPGIIEHNQQYTPQPQSQQQYQQNANCPPVQRQDSGYYSQASTPGPFQPPSRPMSSISSISSISSVSSPVGSRPQSISFSNPTPYAPYPTHQQPLQAQFTGRTQQVPYPSTPQTQTYNPQQHQPYNPQAHQQYNPQNHGRSQSVASYSTTTNNAAPPPYFSPLSQNIQQPNLSNNEKGRDYFGQAGQQQQQNQYIPQRGSVVGPPAQWQQQQWAPPPTKVQEPNYGPPPAVPGVWRG